MADQHEQNLVYLKKYQVRSANYGALRAQKYRQAKMKYKSTVGTKQTIMKEPFEVQEPPWMGKQSAKVVDR